MSARPNAEDWRTPTQTNETAVVMLRIMSMIVGLLRRFITSAPSQHSGLYGEDRETVDHSVHPEGKQVRKYTPSICEVRLAGQPGSGDGGGSSIGEP